MLNENPGTDANQELDVAHKVLRENLNGRRHDFHVGANLLVDLCLVGVLCMRFGMGKPRLMGDLIVEALREIDGYNGLNVHRGNNYVGSHMSRLWNWMMIMSDHAKTMALPLLNENLVNSVEMVNRGYNSGNKQDKN